MKGLRTCIYKVAELDKAKNWYAEAFDTKPYFDEPYYVGFNIGGYELGLQEEEANEKTKGENIHVLWGVENIQQAFDRLISIGASVHEEPYNVGGDVMVATVKDPWQNIIGLVFNPHFKVTE